MKRKEIYKVIDGERDYQDKKWGGKANDEKNTIEDWLIFVTNALSKSFDAEYTQKDSEKALDELRQAVALGIACFEVYGVPERIKPLHDEYV